MRSSFHVLVFLLVVSALTAVQCGRKEASPPLPTPPEAETETPDIPIPGAVLVQEAPADEIPEPEQEEADVATPEEAAEVVRIELFDQGPLHVNGQPVSGDTFEDQLQELERILTERRAQADRDGREIVAVIAPDGPVLWGKVVEVFNRCSRAELEHIGFAPVEPAGDPDVE